MSKLRDFGLLDKERGVNERMARFAEHVGERPFAKASVGNHAVFS